MKLLIVNADDFGRSPGVNQGILDAHTQGIVTSTTVMINLPDAAPGLDLLQQHAPDLGTGLHLNLTSGRPVSGPDRVRSLVNDSGAFYTIGEWAAQIETFDPDHVQREITAQIERFISLTGQPPDHLDAHHHASYLHPAGLETMLAAATSHAIPMRNAGLDLPPETVMETLTAMMPDLPRPFALALIEDLKVTLVDNTPPFWPARFEMGFFGEHATLGDLLVILTTLPDDSITEIMCHPGYPDDALSTSGYRDERATEVDHLTHAATLECVRAEGIQLITFGDLPGSPGALA